MWLGVLARVDAPIGLSRLAKVALAALAALDFHARRVPSVAARDGQVIPDGGDEDSIGGL